MLKVYSLFLVSGAVILLQQRGTRLTFASGD